MYDSVNTALLVNAGGDATRLNRELREPLNCRSLIASRHVNSRPVVRRENIEYTCLYLIRKALDLSTAAGRDGFIEAVSWVDVAAGSGKPGIAMEHQTPV